MRRLVRFLGGSARVLTALVVVTLITPVATAGVILATNLFVPLPAKIPKAESIEAIQFSHVYDQDGNEIWVYQQFDSNIPVELDEIPAVLKSAVIAAEDRNFYEHGGVDVRGTVRALWADLRTGALVQGGSTITQQLVKNAYGVGSDRTVNRKVREAVLAAQLDRSLTKDEILHEYLSIVYFGEGAYGVGAAAQTYFRKDVRHLSLSEAAMIAGVIPAPSKYNPRVDPATAEIRRRSVLDAMLGEGLITSTEHAAAMQEEVWLEGSAEPPPDYKVTLIRTRESQTSNYFIDYLTQFLTEQLGGDELLYTGGLEIHTTLDRRAEFLAAAAAADAIAGVEPIVTKDANGNDRVHTLQIAIASVEPGTGYVRAVIGGRDYAFDQTNIAVPGGGGSGRQPGSSFKPFVLAEAFEQGIQPTASYSGASHTIGQKTFRNYCQCERGVSSLRSAMQASTNTVFTRLMEEVGVENVLERAERLGIDMPELDPSIHGSGIQFALGAHEVFPLSMASAYGVFANSGVRLSPTPVRYVEDLDGEVIVDFRSRTGEQVLKPAVADNVTSVLEGVLTSGTARGRGIDRPAAGKTGTTSNARDGWFVGYTPTLSTAVFMGYDPPGPLEGRPLLVRGRQLTGGSFPAATWQQYMKAVLADVPITDFNEPAPIRAEADLEELRARRGFGPSPQRRVDGTSAGDYIEEAESPAAPAPTTTSSTSTSTTTSTSTPEGGTGDGDGDDLGAGILDDG